MPDISVSKAVITLLWTLAQTPQAFIKRGGKKSTLKRFTLTALIFRNICSLNLWPEPAAPEMPVIINPDSANFLSKGAFFMAELPMKLMKGIVKTAVSTTHRYRQCWPKRKCTRASKQLLSIGSFIRIVGSGLCCTRNCTNMEWKHSEHGNEQSKQIGPFLLLPLNPFFQGLPV